MLATGAISDRLVSGGFNATTKARRKTRSRFQISFLLRVCLRAFVVVFPAWLTFTPHVRGAQDGLGRADEAQRPKADRAPGRGERHLDALTRGGGAGVGDDVVHLDGDRVTGLGGGRAEALEARRAKHPFDSAGDVRV